MRIRRVRPALIAMALSLFAAIPAGAVPSPAEQAANLRIYDKAWSIVGRRYWDRTMHGLDWAAERDRFAAEARDAEDARALYAAINRLLGRLGDSHVYATSAERRAFTRAADEPEAGFGFDAYEADGAWWIHHVQPGGPAAAAGMQIGWKLVSIDGKPVDVDTHFGSDESARLVLIDEHGRRHDMALKGIPLDPEPSRRVRRLPGGVLVLAFDQFSAGEADWIARALRDTPDLTGVILDMRENEGGAADVLDRIAGLFVADSQVVLRLTARRTRDERTRGRPRWLGPLALLVGPRSASAAEALAAFLGESGRAVTVGERTAGALTGGAEHRLPDGGRLTVAENDIHTPAGDRLEGRGFTPRHIVKPTLRQLRAGQDPALDAAVALLGKASTGPPGVVSTN